jgi:hypothetical protein
MMNSIKNLFFAGIYAGVIMSGCKLTPDPISQSIAIYNQSDYTEIVLSNKLITARYTSHNPSALTNLFINEGRDDVAGGTNWKYLDAIESCGSIKYARTTQKLDTLETVEVLWENQSESHITIFKSMPLLKIDYYIGQGKITDVGATRGSYNNKVAFYNNNPQWVADDTHQYNDYKGFIIAGVFNSVSGKGFGRILPYDNNHNTLHVLPDSGGLEYNFNSLYNKYPITSYIYAVSKGKEELLELGKNIVDWHLNNFIQE